MNLEMGMNSEGKRERANTVLDIINVHGNIVALW